MSNHQQSIINNIIKNPIPMYTPLRDIEQHQEKYQNSINQILKHGKFILGPEVTDLEQDLANYVRIRHCIAVGSGTDALLVALLALKVQPGDEIITVAHTWISTAEVISLIGATPIFIDINPNTFLMDISQIEKHITVKTKGIIYVSLYGQFENPKTLLNIAQQHDLWIIDDAAQSFGAELNHPPKTTQIKLSKRMISTTTKPSIRSCAWATVSCTSFFPSKPLGAFGDAGACFCQDYQLANRMKAIRNHGALERFNHRLIGLNARMDSFQGAILRIKLKTLNQALERRREIATYYTQALQHFSPHLIKLPMVIPQLKPVWAQYSIILESENTRLNRDYIVDQLRKANIQVSIFYPKGLHQQPCFHLSPTQSLPNTDYVCQNIFNLPIFPELTQDEIDYIVITLSQILLD